MPYDFTTIPKAKESRWDFTKVLGTAEPPIVTKESSVLERIGGFLQRAGQLPGEIQPYTPQPPSVFKQPAPVVAPEPTVAVEPISKVGMGYVREAEAKPPTEEELMRFARPYTPPIEKLTPEQRVALPAPSKIIPSLTAGIGDVITTAGGAAKWLGAKKVGEAWTAKGEEMRKAHEIPAEEFSWRRLLDPNFYTTNVMRSIPFSAALIPAAVAGAYGLGSAGAAMGLGAFGKAVLGAVGGGVLNRAVEGALEAGGTYNEAIARGMTEEQADKAAQNTFKKNLALAGMDIGEFATAFVPIPGAKTVGKIGKVALGAGRLALTAGQEAAEEGIQEVIQRRSLGEKAPVSELLKQPATQEAMTIGAIHGGGLGAAGTAFNEIKSRVIAKLPSDVQGMVNTAVEQMEAAGVPKDRAEVQALDAVAETPQGQKAIQDAVNEVRETAEAAGAKESAKTTWFTGQQTTDPARLKEKASLYLTTDINFAEGYVPSNTPDARKEDYIFRVELSDNAKTLDTSKHQDVERVVDRLFSDYEKGALDAELYDAVERTLGEAGDDVEQAKKRFVDTLSPTEIRNESAYDSATLQEWLYNRFGYDVVTFEQGDTALLLNQDAAKIEKAKEPAAVQPTAEAKGPTAVELTPTEQKVLDLSKRKGKSLDELEKGIQERYDRMIEEHYQWLKKNSGRGVQPRAPMRDAEGTIIGWRPNISENPPWYQELYKREGRKPSNKVLREVAKEHLREGFTDFTGPVEPDPDFLKLERGLSGIRELKRKLAAQAPRPTARPEGVAGPVRRAEGPATPAVEAELSSEVDKVVEEVSPPVGLSIRVVKNPPPTKGEGFKFSDAATEARYQRAHEGVQREGFWTQIQEIGRTLRNKMMREYEHLPRTGEFAPLRYEGLLPLAKQKGVAGDRTVRLQQGIISQMLKNPTTFNLFERKVLLDDLVEEMDAGHDLPLGFTKETVPKEVERLNQEIAKYPEIADALQKRSKAWDAIKKDYIKAMRAIGFDVEKRFTKKNYFRHQVLEYANARAVSGTGQRIKTPTGRGFLKARQGSTHDINTNYLQADFEVMAQMLYDIEVAKVIDLVQKRYNIVDRLKREAARLNMVRLNEMAEKDETISARLKAFRQQIAIGMDRLGKLAEKDELPAGEKDEFEDVLEGLMEERERLRKLAEEDIPVSAAVGTPGAPMGEEGKRFFAYLSWLLEQDTEGAKGAGQILKAVSHRRRFIRETLGARFKTYEDIIPEGYEIWQPREGNVFYFVDSIPSQMAQQLMESKAEEIGVKPDDIRQALAMGGPRREFVVKSEVAKTLDNFGRKAAADPVSKAVRTIMGGWKEYQLIHPKRVIKYNARNLSGDAEAVFLGNPSTFKKVGQAASELYQTLYGDRSMTPTMRDWFERGGMESTLQVAELGDINQLRMFSKLFEDKRSIPKKMWDSYVSSARLGTDFREAILRYAAYLDYLEQMQKTGKPNNFGASIPEEIMALKDVKDRAFVLANQLLGAYDQVSVAGQAIRTYLAPFWSWKEVNAKRYVQLVRNAASDGKLANVAGRTLTSTLKRSPLIALRVGKFLIKASGLWAMLTAFNNLKFPDEERDLPEDVRSKPHIVLGRDKDGKVKYFDRLGILEDMLEWFGLDAPQSLVVDYLNGRKTMKDIAAEMGKGFVNTAVQTLGPHIKTPVELLMGKKTYPDIFKPGSIRDKWLYLAESVGLGDEYKALTNMPARPYSGTLQNIISSSADPGESSYYDILDEKNEYMRKIGKGSDYGGAVNPRSKALYYLKMAVRYGDKAAFEKYLVEYVAAGGSEKGYEASIRSMDPLYGLTSSEKKDFEKEWLDEEGRRKLKLAQEFYEEVIEKGEKIPGATRSIKKELPSKPKK